MLAAAALVGLLTLGPAAPAVGQDFGVSLDEMTPAQVRTFLEVAQKTPCSCPNCQGLTLLNCRISKPGCGHSKRALQLAVQLIKAGQGADEVMATLNMPPAPAPIRPKPTTPPAPAVDPSTLKVGEAATLGPKDAKVTVFTFSDFQ